MAVFLEVIAYVEYYINALTYIATLKKVAVIIC